MNEIERQYQSKMEAALRKGDFKLYDSIKARFDIYLNSKQQITTKEITDIMTTADKDKCNKLLQKIPVFADLCESNCVDLEEMLKKYENSATLPMLALIKQMNFLAKKVREIVNCVNDIEFAASFGDTCDRVSEAVENIFNNG